MSLSNILLIPGLGGGQNLLLDKFPGAVAAYSLSKMRTAYSGSCIRVRRASDSAEQDIGFAGRFLDTSSITTFCGASNGLVATVYDQSGNSFNAINTVLASQPKIYDASTGLVLDGGLPAIYSDGTQGVASTAIFPSTGDITFDIFGVYNRVSGELNNDHVIGITAAETTSDRRRVCFHANGTSDRSTRLGGGFTTYNSAFSGRSCVNVNYQGGGGEIAMNVNGSPLTVSSFLNTGLNVQANASFKLLGIDVNAVTDVYSGAEAYFQEAVFYLSEQTSRLIIQQDQQAYWGIS